MMNVLKRTGLFLTGVLLCACAGNLHAQQVLSLDGVITQAAKDVETRLSAGAKLAVLNFTSTAEAFSDYVIEELSGALVMNRKVTIIERKSLDLIRKEMNLQLSGDVSDDSAQAIGKQLGAQAIVTGSLTNLGDTYRFRVKVINVETARIEAQFSYNLGNNPQVAFLLSGSEKVPPISAVSPSVSPGSSGAVAAAQPNKVYKIGDTGPAGGFIFYDKGNSSGDWRYLEAAPATTEGKNLQWSVSAFDTGAKGVEVGTGKQNTRNIMDASVQAAVNAPAARLCDRLEYGGYDDWYLPSKNELGLMYMNLKVDGIGGFANEWYWSSSESGYNGGVWTQNFSDGVQGNDGRHYSYMGYKGQGHNVRAIRQF
jgi:TolB-like protein